MGRGVIADRKLQETKDGSAPDLVPSVAGPLADGEPLRGVTSRAIEVAPHRRDRSLHREDLAQHVYPRLGGDVDGLVQMPRGASEESGAILRLGEMSQDLVAGRFLSLLSVT